ncbi:MAG: aminotransferase class III-fold pyridoxal phosphate-dependent enzyme, partial [Actinobacteria bacterium]|nr:aminotransferase class III-fold pyridoxal phosphate-dependent enzyme [Actinomycetota bacterium]
MEDIFFKKDFFSKIVEPRKKIINYDLILKEKVKKRNLGPKTKRMLLESLDFESSGQVGYAFFDVPPLIEKAKNDRVYDVDGKEYIDMLCGVAVSSIGHCHPEILQTISEQSKKLIHNFDFPTPPRIELAKKLCSITPGGFEKKVRFSITGSDGVENAIHSARWYTGCQYILSAYGGYHGATLGTIGITTKGGLHRYYYPLVNNNGVVYFPYAYCYRCPHGR